MIALQRPMLPAVLRQRAPRETTLLWARYRNNERLVFNAAVYSHPTVKKSLRDAQFGKCAYCETLNARSHDVIEHYRPKEGFRQVRRERLSKPQYFWLAYDWDNLLFACDMCNDAGHKQNLFPLSNPNSRATPGSPNLRDEEPLLLNPYVDDPADHIGWDKDVPVPLTERGRTTIEVFGLDRDQTLIDQRRGRFQAVECLIEFVESAPDTPQRRRVALFLHQQLTSSAQYSAMIRAAFTDRIAALR